MMQRLVMRLAVMSLIGIVIFGCGTGGEGQAACLAGPGLAALIKRTLHGVGALLSPATAEAAGLKKKTKHTAKKSTPKKSVKLAATPHKKRAKEDRHKKRGKVLQAKASGHPAAKVQRHKKGGKVIAAKKGRAKAAVASQGQARTKVTKRVGGRCEPQSLTYARQRSGIMRSRNGRENGPLTWFSSEKRQGMTSDQPAPGSVLILGSDRGHGMTTGHVAYVEKAYAEGPSRYKVIFSHTNYDRKCSLETNIEALYDSSAKTLDIYSGAWQPWGRNLRVAGFIHQD